MNIVLQDGDTIFDASPIAMCTGYKAESIVMKKGDFEKLRKLAYSDPVKFNAVMSQLEGRFADEVSFL